MRILVTGCAGFLGRHLCAALLTHGHEVFGIDNFSTGTNLKIDGVTVREANVIDCVFSAEEEATIDFVYHLACPASPRDYQKDPIATWKTSVLGTLNVLEFCKRGKQKGFLFTSTSEVYGEPLEHPQRERLWSHLHTLGPRSCYDVGKAAAETLIHDFVGVPRVTIRIFNTYGPGLRQSDGRVISNLIVQALQNQPMTIYGNGSQTRSFCFVSDLIKGLICAAKFADAGTNPLLFNLGNPKEHTILKAATLIKNLIPNSSSEIQFCDLPIDDPSRRLPDITKAQSILQWSPEVDFEQGLQLTINAFSLK